MNMLGVDIVRNVDVVLVKELLKRKEVPQAKPIHPNWKATCMPQEEMKEPVL